MVSINNPHGSSSYGCDNATVRTFTRFLYGMVIGVTMFLMAQYSFEDSTSRMATLDQGQRQQYLKKMAQPSQVQHPGFHSPPYPAAGDASDPLNKNDFVAQAKDAFQHLEQNEHVDEDDSDDESDDDSDDEDSDDEDSDDEDSDDDSDDEDSDDEDSDDEDSDDEDSGDEDSVEDTKALV